MPHRIAAQERPDASPWCQSAIADVAARRSATADVAARRSATADVAARRSATYLF
ncbi:MAG: hypothetical protein FWE95_00710 [Planctomycetaceae bacterium]|nr:hypothetical protein [Planctomycetaceae bacterium]